MKEQEKLVCIKEEGVTETDRGNGLEKVRYTAMHKVPKSKAEELVANSVEGKTFTHTTKSAYKAHSKKVFRRNNRGRMNSAIKPFHI